MKVALITTTIHVPEVLREYRERFDGPIFIAGDRKTPDFELRRLASELGSTFYLSPLLQQESYPALSSLVGWNCIQRRNFALLAAAKTDADVILSIDDDNAPQGDYFADLEASFEAKPRPRASGEWFNLGEFAEDSYRYRGYPLSQNGHAEIRLDHLPHEIGIVNGAIYGDPDINATERLEKNPEARAYHGVVHKGIVCDPKMTWAPINSQNTAYRRELWPLAMVLPGVGRYDDIWASYIAQRVLMETDYHVLFGRPFARQDRHPHDLCKDLEDELLGMRETDQFCAQLRRTPARQTGIVDILAAVTRGLGVLPPQAYRFCEEWVKTCRSL